MMIQRVTLVSLALVATSATASPMYDSFGALPEATFGGSGIPNDAVAISTYENPAYSITLGLSAAQRFASPEVTNDGAGTFFAEPGESDPGVSTWNMNYYMALDLSDQLQNPEVPTAQLTGLPTFRLAYDVDPGQDSTDQGTLDIPMEAFRETGVVQGSQNLGFGFLYDGSLPGIQPPDGSFDPFAQGTYSIELAAIGFDGDFQYDYARSAIDVQVGEASQVPLPGTAWLLVAGLLGLAGFGHRARASRH